MLQNHTQWKVPRWIGTHGDMISSDIHGVENPTRGMLRPQWGAMTDHRVCTGEEEEDVPPEAAWQSLTQGGCAFSTRTLALEGP
jgi:hypothetical protein